MAVPPRVRWTLRSNLPVWQQRAQIAHLGEHLPALLDQEALDRVTKAGIADPMGAVGGHRLVAALQLVRPLGSRFHARETAPDGELDRLVVAGLEVQELELAARLSAPAT